MSDGLVDADLGSGLVKRSRGGAGEEWRLSHAGRDEQGESMVFVFGFAKNERGNIDKDEEEALKKLGAPAVLAGTQAMDQAARAGELIEVNCDA